MKARLPEGYGKGAGSMATMVKQAHKMQEEVEKLTAELEATDYETTVGGGAVVAVVSGKKEIKTLTIKPEVVDPEDIEMLQDLIISAVNECIRKVEADSEAKMGKLTGNMDLGGLSGLL